MSTLTKNVGVVGSLPTTLLRSNATVENIRDALGDVDASDLPESTREIIDDLRARESRARLGSDSISELRNYVENGARLGSGASPEITRDYADQKMREKCSAPESPATSRASVPAERIINVAMESRPNVADKLESPLESQLKSETKAASRGRQPSDQALPKLDHSRPCGKHTHKKVTKNKTSSTRTIETREKTSTVCGPRSHTNEIRTLKDTKELTTSEEEFEEIYKYSSLKEDNEIECYTRITGAGDNGVEATSNERQADNEKLETSDYQGQDSSSSATSLSTVKYNPMEAWQADIYSIIAEEARKSKLKRDVEKAVESSSLKSRLPLLKVDESYDVANGHEAPVTPEPIPYSPVEDLYYVPLESGESYGKSQSGKIPAPGPDSLKDVCIRKILSMPYGVRIIHEITVARV